MFRSLIEYNTTIVRYISKDMSHSPISSSGFGVYSSLFYSALYQNYPKLSTQHSWFVVTAATRSYATHKALDHSRTKTRNTYNTKDMIKMYDKITVLPMQFMILANIFLPIITLWTKLSLCKRAAWSDVARWPVWDRPPHSGNFR